QAERSRDVISDDQRHHRDQHRQQHESRQQSAGLVALFALSKAIDSGHYAAEDEGSGELNRELREVRMIVALEGISQPLRHQRLSDWSPARPTLRGTAGISRLRSD